MLVQAGLSRTCSETTLLVFPRGGSNVEHVLTQSYKFISCTGKLREFNSNIEPSKKLDESAINGLEGMLNGVVANTDNLNHLKSILEWPPSKLNILQQFIIFNCLGAFVLYSWVHVVEMEPHI